MGKIEEMLFSWLLGVKSRLGSHLIRFHIVWDSYLYTGEKSSLSTMVRPPSQRLQNFIGNLLFWALLQAYVRFNQTSFELLIFLLSE